MDAAVAARLDVDGVTLDADDVALLRAIDSEGSLNAAADALGRSYSRVQKRVTAIEDAVGPLVERERGGAAGGGSRLTDTARELLARFDRLRTALTETAHSEETVLTGTVRERAGDLATVDTPAGTVTALLSRPAEKVQVSIRADTVTLHDPDDAPGGRATSARNRFEGTVTAVDPADGVVRVAVDVDAPAPLVALVTEGSRDRLELAPGRRVVASFKATATHATPAPEEE
ncbi:MAG: TOBE domain-containing protein [Haloarculaceae archaeon]